MYKDFEKWVNCIFEKEIPKGVVALSFNLYEDEKYHWSMEVVGTSTFDEDNEDWACDEITDFDSRKDLFSWQEESDWEKILSETVKCLRKYLETGEYAGKLKSVKGIGAGFVDGDLELVYGK